MATWDEDLDAFITACRKAGKTAKQTAAALRGHRPEIRVTRSAVTGRWNRLAAKAAGRNLEAERPPRQRYRNRRIDECTITAVPKDLPGLSDTQKAAVDEANRYATRALVKMINDAIDAGALRSPPRQPKPAPVIYLRPNLSRPGPDYSLIGSTMALFG